MWRHGVALQQQLSAALGLVSSVLKPDLHLRFREAQRPSQIGPVCAREVTLTAETTLQRQYLPYYTWFL